MNVNKVLTKDYENKPNWTLGENEPKTNPIKPNVGSLGYLFDHIEIFVFKTKLKILILQDRFDILLINEALRLIR
ncbi:MAG: hypothetical protein ACYTEW_16675 [Planctomycetota bacterium]|jgi:hypothetical protein